MGRFYSGDIEGKFWFGVQPSDDASFFGGKECEPYAIQYYFSKENIPEINEGIKTCKKELGIYKTKLDKYWKNNGSYNEKGLAEYLKTTENKVKTFLEWYARLELGNKILKCVKAKGDCSFDAEL